MAGDHLVIQRAEDRYVPECICKGQGDRLETCGPFEGRGASALAKQALGDQNGDAGGQEVEGDAADQLVAAEGDRGNAVNGRQDEGGGDACQQAKPDGACQKGDGPGGHRGHQHLAFQPDVENARAFGIKSRKTGKQQGRCKAEGGIEDLQKGGVIHQTAPSLVAARKRNTHVRPMRTITSSAPVNRITRPCTTIRSSIGIEVHMPSSAPP